MSRIIIPGHKKRYWGYVDDEDKITVHLYTSDRQIENTEKMPWCKGIFDPFEAEDILQARMICKIKYQEVQYYERKIIIN